MTDAQRAQLIAMARALIDQGTALDTRAVSVTKDGEPG